ncbi:MAG: hypothetical protein JXQ87_06330 [Bacteroidia bacterium]
MNYFVFGVGILCVVLGLTNFNDKQTETTVIYGSLKSFEKKYSNSTGTEYIIELNEVSNKFYISSIHTGSFNKKLFKQNVKTYDKLTITIDADTDLRKYNASIRGLKKGNLEFIDQKERLSEKTNNGLIALLLGFTFIGLSVLQYLLDKRKMRKRVIIKKSN